MARDPRVKVRLEGEDNLTPKVEKAQGSFARFGQFLASRFVLTLGDVRRVVADIVGVFGDWIAAAQEQEDAVKSLDAALAGLGPRAEEVSEGLQAQAAALQEVTRFGDEAVIQAQSLLATLGVQADQLPLATQATVDLAAALGISLEAAARNVGRTVGGLAGELGEVIPELRNLSAEALKAGEGIELLAEKFGGRAAADAQTFSGLMAQLSNAFGDLQENAGEAITQNEGIRESLSKLVGILKSDELVSLVEGLAGGLADVGSEAIDLAAALPAAVETVGDLGRGIGVIAEEAGIARPELAAFGSAGAEAAGTYDGAAASIQRFIDRVIGIGAASREAAEETEALADETERAGEAAEKAAKGHERLEEILKAEKETLAEVDDIAKRFGVTLETEVNQELERNATALEKAEAAARGNVISWEDYERIAAAAAGKNRELRESVETLSESQVDAVESIESYAEATGRAADEQVRLRQTAIDTTAALAEQAAAAKRESGGGFGFTERTTGFQFENSRSTFTTRSGVRTDANGRMVFV